VKITIGEADGKGVSFDLDTLLVTRLLIQANSGAGKSWLLRKLIEQLYGHVQVIVIDPEGEFATLREKYDFVLVGAGGETPADVRSAGLLAEKLLELRASAVCDLYEMRPLDRHLWVKAFLEAMVNAPKKLWHPCVVIVDEAQLFCPQDGESKAEEAMVSLTTRGRKRGFCAVWATQRLAKVNKDATAMLLNRLVGGTFEDVDIKRALDLLSVAAEDKREMSQQLRTLDPGWFFAFGRAITKERLLIKVGQVETSHPQPGSAKHAAAPPPAPEKIKGLLPQLADLPAAAEEKARTVAELQSELRKTKAALAVAIRQKAEPTVTTKVVTPNVSNLVRIAREFASAALDVKVDAAIAKILADQRRSLRGGIERILAEVSLLNKSQEIERTSSAAREETAKIDHPHVFTGGGRARPLAGPSITPAENNGRLSNSQLRILGALAQFEAIGRAPVPKKWIAALSGASHSSSAYGNNLGYLRSSGYIDYPAPGNVALTETGRDKAPEVTPPATTAEMIDRCKKIISGSQARILDVLVDQYPKAIDKGQLADAAGASATSSAYGNNLGALRSAGMIDYPDRGLVRAADWLFLEAA